MTHHRLDKAAQSEWLPFKQVEHKLTWKEVLFTIIMAFVLYFGVGYGLDDVNFWVIGY